MARCASNGIKIVHLCHLSVFYFERTEDGISQFTVISILPQMLFLKWRIRVCEIKSIPTGKLIDPSEENIITIHKSSIYAQPFLKIT